MFSALSIAATGLRNQQFRIDTIGSNVSNVNTVGYKSARLDFRTALHTVGRTPGPVRSPEENQQAGHGVMLAGIARDWRGGAMQRTDRDMDFALENEGFFTIQNPDGTLMFTRNGNFSLSPEPGGLFFTNAQGAYVLGADGERIMMPLDATSVASDNFGNLRFMRGDEILGEAALGIVTFRNLKGLEAIGSSNFMAGPSAGEMLPADGVVVRQGTLEISNVNLAEEMTRLIRTQRAFQLASRALTTADDMEGIANNMRR